ncbi:hypothetical protein DFQ27_003777 [Actinomortierella ambigua]|uniref:RNI-like protein n=1 Tax=Actinomortierella ambigua TaxID=1343610 RepID=A0A9P6U544_9FUNG|nr:hypothetical protein DFQ27_003777 [Actinomortierella ambigua]
MLYQEFRQGPEVARIQVLTDSQTSQQYIRLDDIQEVFPDAFRFCVDGNSVSFMIAADGTKYDNPRRVPYVPGRVLDVIARSGSLSPSTSPTPSRSPSPLHSFGGSGLGSPATPHQLPLPPPRALTGPTPPSSSNTATTLTATTTTTSFYTSTSSLTLTAAATALSTLQPPEVHFHRHQQQHCNGDDGGGDIQYQHEAQQVLYQARLLLESVQSHQASSHHLLQDDLIHTQQQIQANLSRLEQAVQGLQASQTRQHQAIVDQLRQMQQMQQQALERLAWIQGKVAQILVQSWELVEYPIPRLFVVLPDTRRRRWDPTRMWTNRFRLYFLCECGGGGGGHGIAGPHIGGGEIVHRHTRLGSPSLTTSAAASPPRSPPRPSSSSSSSSPKRSPPTSDIGSSPRSIHIAPHEGYEILRPTEFFEKYGPYILGLLNILKYGLTTASIAVPAINQLQVVDGVKQAANNIRSIASDTLVGIDQSIAYLEHTLGLQQQSDGGAEGEGRGNRMGEIQALEGADLRRLESFLRVRDPDRVLGNLYRSSSSDEVGGGGHVQWVCLDHYRLPYREQAIQQLVNSMRIAGLVSSSSLDVHRRRASVTVRSSLALTEFLTALTQCPVIDELHLVLDFAFSYTDLSALKHALHKTNVHWLSIDGCENKGSGPAVAVDLLAWPPGKYRFDPILRILATNPRLQRLCLANLAKFSQRTSSSSLLNGSGGHPSPSSLESLPPPVFGWLRTFHYAHEMDERDQRRLAEILRACPRLYDVRLGNAFDSYVYPDLWKALAALRELEILHLYGVTDMVDDISEASSRDGSADEEEEEEEEASRNIGDESDTDDEQGITRPITLGDKRMRSLSPPGSVVSSPSSSVAMSRGRAPSQRSQQSSQPRGGQTMTTKRSRSKEALSFVDYFAQAYRNRSMLDSHYSTSSNSKDNDGDVDMDFIPETLFPSLEQSRLSRLRELVLVRSGLTAGDILRWLRVIVGDQRSSSRHTTSCSSLSPSSAVPPTCALEVLQVELVGMYPIDLQALFVDHCPQITHRMTRLWLNVATVDERNLQALRMALRALPLLTHLGLVLEDDGGGVSSDGSNSGSREGSRSSSYDSYTTTPTKSTSCGEGDHISSGTSPQTHHHHHFLLSSALPPAKEPGLTTSILSSIVDLSAISHLYLGRFDCRELAPFLLAAATHPHARLHSLTLDGLLHPREGQLPELLRLLTSCSMSDDVDDDDDDDDDDDENSSNNDPASDPTATTLSPSLPTLTHLALANLFEPDDWLAHLITQLDFSPLCTLVLNYVALGPDATAALLARAPEFLGVVSSPSSPSPPSPPSLSSSRKPLEKLMLYGIDEMSMDIQKFLETVRKRALAGLPAHLQQQQQNNGAFTVKHGFISSHDMAEWMRWLD